MVTSKFFMRIWARFKARRAERSLTQYLLARRWSELPSHLQTQQQLAGVAGVSCGATHSVMEKCNFACTSCYLSAVANYARPLPFDQVREQLDALRRYLGEGGKAQITSGEVTLLPKQELGRIVAYARQIGLDPMVMTNGQRLLQVPDYLTTLVRDYGLEKISIHIDTTQKGRPDMALGVREREIHPIRDRFAQLIKKTRQTTGKRLHAAQTVTVTRDTLDDIPDVVDWALDHVDSFRLLSFLPVAGVGRTCDQSLDDVNMDQVWEKICAGVGRQLNRHAMHYGHTQCNITVPVVVAVGDGQRHIVEVVRQGKAWDLRLFRRLLRQLGPHVDLNGGPLFNAPALLARFGRRPDLLFELLVYALYRLWGERALVGRFLLRFFALRPLRLRSLLLVVHKFMDADELQTPLGRERLDACVFKLPVDGRMISMCEMNATSLRLELNERRLEERGAGVDRLNASRRA